MGVARGGDCSFFMDFLIFMDANVLFLHAWADWGLNINTIP